MRKMPFLTTPYERAIEISMQQKPDFKPKGGGIYIMSRFKYTAKTCDCQYCPEYIRKGKQCRAKEYLCFNERLEAGVVNYAELVQKTFKEVNSRAFQMRLLNIISESKMIKMFYRGTEHKKKFTNEIIVIGCNTSNLSPEFLSALFLLTSENKLWQRVKNHVKPVGINFISSD